MRVVGVLLHLVQGLGGQVQIKKDVVRLAALRAVDRGQFKLRLFKYINAAIEQSRCIYPVLVADAVKDGVPVSICRFQTKLLSQHRRGKKVLFVGTGQHLLGTALEASLSRRDVIVEVDGFFMRNLVRGAALDMVPSADGIADVFFK